MTTPMTHRSCMVTRLGLGELNPDHTIVLRDRRPPLFVNVPPRCDQVDRQSSASHALRPPLPVTLCTIDTSTELTKNPSESVLRNNPVLMVFIPFGHSRKKKSSCPMYVKASPAPTRKNCGISQNTLSRIVESFGLDRATFRRLISVRAAAAIARMERTRPTPMRWSGLAVGVAGEAVGERDDEAVVDGNGDEDGADEEHGEGARGDLEGRANAAVHGGGLRD
ncbi:hypothetical protein ACMD2_20683 [Ananas comosus]|uniref:Uncharacterized protein n=1 Tax=Ananas comosus TaxID=4615 RepID=A0A199VXL9_ANACO|nr:hypothetical protein ACMD2_20683 [Ananas comosus]